MRKEVILLIVIPWLITACNNIKKENDSSTPTITINLNDIYKPNFKEIFSSIEICPLETKESLVGNLFRRKKAIYIPDKFYIIIDDDYVIHIFNKKGEFISNSSKCIGQGPHEYYILQDVAFNKINNTLDILDPFGNITSFSENFNFKSRKKINAQTKDRFRKLFPIDNSQYILLDDTERGSFILYDINKDKTIKKITYPGLIAEMSANSAPFNYYNNELLFIPPEVNNYIFIYNKEKKEITPNLLINGGTNSINKSDLNNLKSIEERSTFIFRDSPKYSPVNRLYSKDYLISTYVKQTKLFINIYNTDTHNNKTFKTEKELKLNLPEFFAIENNTAFAIIHPMDLEKFIDKDLITNKNILRTIKEDDNPCIIKYNIKL